MIIFWNALCWPYSMVASLAADGCLFGYRTSNKSEMQLKTYASSEKKASH